jgi:lysyl-tRNA synthetase, class II
MSEELGINEIREQRIENMRRLQELGYAPFGGAFPDTLPLGEIEGCFEEGRSLRLAGRLVAIRKMGKSAFAHIQEQGCRFQIYAQKNVLGDEDYEAFKVLDLGDIIGVEGELFLTRTGEQTLKVTKWTLLAKSLLPLPEKFHGLQDKETRYRQRYLDLISNPEVMELFVKRSRAVAEIRAYLQARGFLEVETPMLQALAGGAAAEPFRTHYKALNSDMFLRIAPELYLKRLLVGGFDKVFELNRNFRNEGLDRSHNPEFTMIELYQAYGDVGTMKELVQGMIIHVAETVFGTLQVGSAEEPVDLRPAAWREVEYETLIRERAGEDWFELDLERARVRAAEMGCEIDPDWDMLDLSQEVFEKLIEKTLLNPTFVTRLPARLVPLASPCADSAEHVDVFELIIGGKEIAPAYTELNNPLIQRERFLAQAGGDESRIDRDFVTALEHGMPPAGGMGIGIDRLIMLLAGAHSIRDVILFPHLKSAFKPV